MSSLITFVPSLILILIVFLVLNHMSKRPPKKRDNSVASPALSPTQVADEITKLSALKDAGALTEGEYEVQKNALFNAAQQTGARPNDSSSFGYSVLGFFFPVVGLILWLVWKDSYPLRSISARNGMIAGFVTGIALFIIYMIIVFVFIGSLGGY